MKTIKKLIAIVTIMAFAVGVAVPVSAQTNINTGLTQDTGSGANPIVKAKWEANAADRYTDDSIAAGAQFLPSGQYQVNKNIAVCAVVTDPDGLADLAGVYADVFYPTGIALGPHHIPLTDQSGLGCGALMQEDSMQRLTKTDGYNLFCNSVRSSNNNLPTFNIKTGTTLYGYDEICAADGELMKETAAVYCAEKPLSYEDPSGTYAVWAVAQDKAGLNGILRNSFDYLDLTAFETDFNAVSYGNVKLNTHKIINGNLAWDSPPVGANPATVRNVGNTRLSMKVYQDDMGLGKTNGNWNVLYDGRVGSGAAFTNYYPEVLTTLVDPLDLSEKDEMDFSIDISKFPPTHTGPYTGTMTLSAVKANHLACPTPSPSPTPPPGQ